jgi:hypothetical protein
MASGQGLSPVDAMLGCPYFMPHPAVIEAHLPISFVLKSKHFIKSVSFGCSFSANFISEFRRFVVERQGDRLLLRTCLHQPVRLHT